MPTTAQSPRKKPRKKEDGVRPVTEEKNLAKAYHLLRAMGDAGLVIDRGSGNDLPQARESLKDWQ